MHPRRPIAWLVLLSCVLILLTLPRFDRRDIGIRSITAEGTGALGDAAYYIDMTLYFRGEKSVEDLRPPFSYRALVPYLASLLPLAPITAIDLIDLAAMIVALAFMYKILTRLGLDLGHCILGCTLFVVSFPTFYYATIGYLDPVLVSMLTVGLYMILTHRWIPLAIVIGAGSFVKETIIILVLAVGAYLLFDRKLLSRRGVVFPMMLAVFAIGYYFARTIIPVNPGFGWKPSFEDLVYNITRLRSWLSFFLTFGAPGVLSLWIFRYRDTEWFRERFAVTATMLTGISVSILLFGYAALSAYADGRFVWTSYPFSVPLATIVLAERHKTSPP